MGYRIKDNARCGVIGYGSWATALVHTLERNRKEIWWHIRNEEVLESIQTEGRNAKYLSDIDFDKEHITVYGNFLTVNQSGESEVLQIIKSQLGSNLCQCLNGYNIHGINDTLS